MAIKNLGRVTGKSAYEIWLEQGNTGTEEDFLNSLKAEGSDVDLTGLVTKDDLTNKVDKVTGKSLIADTEIERLKNVTNYDDTELRNQINSKATIQDMTNYIEEHKDGQTINVGKMGDTNFDTNTFIGALREAIEYILTNYPTKHIMLIADTQRNNAGYDVNFTNSAGCKLIDYVNALCKIGELYGLPVCNWYTQSGFNVFTLASYTNDGLHPNTLGYTVLGNLTASFIANMYCNSNESNIWNGKKFIAFGTSITAVGNQYLEIIKTRNGFTSFTNAGASGKSMAGEDGINYKIHNTNIEEYDLILIECSTNDFKLCKELGKISSEVEEIEVVGLSLDKTESTITVEESTMVTASVIPTNATNKKVTWEAENSNVSISSNGLVCTVTGVSEGTCNITCTTVDGNYTKTCLVIVNEEATVEPVEPDTDFTTTYTKGYLSVDGNLSPSSTSNWQTTDFIPTSEGDKFQYIGTTGLGTVEISSVAVYDNNQTYVKTLLEKGDYLDGIIITIPSGVSYLRCCFYTKETEYSVVKLK